MLNLRGKKLLPLSPIRASGEHTHADHATYAAFWHSWLAHLKRDFISRGAFGVAVCYGFCSHLENT